MDYDSLVNNAIKGDKEAFSNIIKECEAELYCIAKARLYNEADVEDAIQETIIHAFKSIKNLKNSKFFKTWLIKILINNCNIIYKEKKCNTTLDYQDNIINKHNNIDNNLEFIENVIDFNNMMKVLNYNERIAITLYYTQGYTNKQIGNILNVSENTVKTRISRAKNKIRKLYKEDLIDG